MQKSSISHFCSILLSRNKEECERNLMVPKDCMLDFREQKLFVDVIASHTTGLRAES